MINGILVGVVVALAQSLFWTAAVKRAITNRAFYWVWIGGIVARAVVLLLTAVLVSTYTSLHLAATLLSLVVATTVFLIIEARFLLTD